MTRIEEPFADAERRLFEGFKAELPSLANRLARGGIDSEDDVIDFQQYFLLAVLDDRLVYAHLYDRHMAEVDAHARLDSAIESLHPGEPLGPPRAGPIFQTIAVLAFGTNRAGRETTVVFHTPAMSYEQACGALRSEHAAMNVARQNAS